MSDSPQFRRPALPDQATIDALTGTPLHVLPVLRYRQRRHGFVLSSARFAGCDTGLEHGPQTYHQAVASEAARLETTTAFDRDRAGAIETAFGLVPAPPAIAEADPLPPELLYVRRVLEAGDHAADLAMQHVGGYWADDGSYVVNR